MAEIQDRSVVIGDTSIVVIDHDEYQREKDALAVSHIVVLVPGYLRIRRRGGTLMMQVPRRGDLTKESVRSGLARWFTENRDTSSNEWLENGVRAVASGVISG